MVRYKHMGLVVGVVCAGVLGTLGLSLLRVGDSSGTGAGPGYSLSSDATRPSYSWPVKPFFVQHVVIAQFGDPRINQKRGRAVFGIHFGVDVLAPDGTAVFATVSGQATVLAARVYVTTQNGRRLDYWHITPSVKNGTHVLARRTVLGHVAPGKGHTHVAESAHRIYVNPLRKDGMVPFEDHTTPVVRGILVLAGPARLPAGDVKGVVDLVAEAYDPPALPKATRKYADNLMAPARLGWRMVTLDGRSVLRWSTAFDVASSFPSVGYGSTAYHDVYARKTRQNEPQRPGIYRFYLVHGLDTRRLANGLYLVEIEARDVRGNRGLLRQAIRITNPARE